MAAIEESILATTSSAVHEVRGLFLLMLGDSMLAQFFGGPLNVLEGVTVGGGSLLASISSGHFWYPWVVRMGVPLDSWVWGTGFFPIKWMMASPVMVPQNLLISAVLLAVMRTGLEASNGLPVLSLTGLQSTWRW